jgi:hypothetical protein
VQKIDTGRVYAMKTLQKVEMVKRDQVRCVIALGSRLLIVFCGRVARTRPRGARRPCRVDVALGRAVVLFVSRSSISVPDHGVPTGWGPNDDADEI